MAQLPILEYPDPRLRRKAQPVTRFDATLRRLAADMLETMYAAPGIGLAAVQVDNLVRMVVLDVSEEKNQPLVLVNPRLTALPGERSCYDEGCLSVPGFYEKVNRPEHIRVRALDRDGQPFTIEPQDLMAVCIQHEVDHLNGKLFVDYLSPLKRQRIRSKLAKLQHATA